MNISIFLDDVTEFNGPLFLIPGSHKAGILEAGHDELSALDARQGDGTQDGRQ